MMAWQLALSVREKRLFLDRKKQALRPYLPNRNRINGSLHSLIEAGMRPKTSAGVVTGTVSLATGPLFVDLRNLVVCPFEILGFTGTVSWQAY